MPKNPKRKAKRTSPPTSSKSTIDTNAAEPAKGLDVVDEASLESFPASDPPGWTVDDEKPKKKGRAAGK